MGYVLFGQLTAGERVPQFSVTAEGIITITRRWQGTFQNLCAIQHRVRASMPPLQEGNLVYGGNLNAKCVSSDIQEGTGPLHMLIEVFQGYVDLPFTVFSLTTTRLDVPIGMHPNFNKNIGGSYGSKGDGYVMYKDIDWQVEAGGNTFTGFSPYVIGTSTDCKFLGVESYVRASIQWKKLSYAADITIDSDLSKKLWKLNAPDATGSGATLPDASNTNNSWLKIQDDWQNEWKGASQLWRREESWWYNEKGWIVEIYKSAVGFNT